MEPNPASPKHVPIRPSHMVAAASAVVCLLAAALFAFLPTASAVEFPPIPTVTSSQQCIDGNYSMEVTIVMANEGTGTAQFHLEWGNTYNGSGIGGGQQNFEVTDTPVESAFKIAEGDAATYTVTSTDGPGADFSLNVPVVDCRADPVASISLVCPSAPAEGPVLVYTYQNNSQVPVDFSFVDTFGPDIVKSAAKDMALPATETRALYEDQAVHAEAYADGVLLDSFDTAVDCAPPNHIVVSKTVVGGTGNPAFPFEVVCHPAGSPESTTVVSTFDLHGGESKSVDLPNPNDLPYCNARELDPGPAWTVTESFNGSPITSSFDDLFFPNDMNYTLDITNTAVVEPTTTTSTTSTTTTTIPVAVSSEEAAAIPVSKTAPRPLSQSGAPAAIAAPTPATNLAQTGSDTSSTLLAGLGLLLAGLVVVGATRRSRRRAA